MIFFSKRFNLRIYKILLWKRAIATFENVQSGKPTLKLCDMPHPRSLPIIGTRADLLFAGSGKQLHKYIDRRHKELGTIFYEKLGGNTKLVFISNPNDMKELFFKIEGKYPTHLLPDPWILYGKLYGNKRGLFFMDGEEWLNNRRVMNKILLRDDSEKWMKEPVLTTVKNFTMTWNNKADKNAFTPDLEKDFYKLSVEVIISILVGNVTALRPNRYYCNLLDTFSESVKKIFQTTTKLYGLPLELYQRYNLKRWTDFKDCVDTSIFMAQKIVVEILKHKNENTGLISKLRQENCSDETITRIIADFVIAAGDTTAYTSMWILYMLSNHQNIVNEYRIKDKSLIKNIIKETMRLFPVAPFLTRILPTECMIGNYQLKKGTPIIASIYTSGRDERNFSQADKFLPYRWDRRDPRRNDLVNHTPSASLPFALGARSCIGRKIAMLQLTELIYQIVNQFDLKYMNENEVKPITSQVLVPNEDIKITVSSRKTEIKDKHKL